MSRAGTSRSNVGRNVGIEYRFAQGRLECVPSLGGGQRRSRHDTAARSAEAGRHRAEMPVVATQTIEPLFEREGRWLFHCHLLVHMSSEYKSMKPLATGSWMPILAMQHATSDATGMAGMVLGI